MSDDQKLLPGNALQELWDEHNKGIGRGGVLAIVVSLLGAATTGMGLPTILQGRNLGRHVPAQLLLHLEFES